ncbi:MAG: ATP-binding protein [Antarcticimicrobium sp.]|uniref:ATP-binding protein n=1 Tax=Antarcticimicrobium sp. TaxID=2824147 RepID=UPI0026277DE1|nr:ATP-binding protein [Antarcticimicrobium sp.]MDF1717048.1 ATP-binding protein [Antarcticimicrobium sp.]
MSHQCSFEFDATDLAARDGIGGVIGRLRASGLPATLVGDVELALVEAVNNVIEHAFGGKPGHRIAIHARLSEAMLDLRIIDDGRPLPGGRVPQAKSLDPGLPRADLPEGGFGWTLIHQLTDQVDYQRRDACNMLSLRFRLTGTPRTGREIAP